MANDTDIPPRYKNADVSLDSTSLAEATVQNRRLRRGAGTPNPIPLTKLRIRLVYPPLVTNSITDRPARNVRYDLDIGGRHPLSGTTDGDGVLECELPVTTKSGKLTLHTKDSDQFWTLNLEFRDLDAHASAGELARLSNLGLLPDEKLAVDNAQYVRARCRFISLYDVPDGTRIEDRIKEIYGS